MCCTGNHPGFAGIFPLEVSGPVTEQAHVCVAVHTTLQVKLTVERTPIKVLMDKGQRSRSRAPVRGKIGGG